LAHDQLRRSLELVNSLKRPSQRTAASTEAARAARREMAFIVEVCVGGTKKLKGYKMTVKGVCILLTHDASRLEVLYKQLPMTNRPRKPLNGRG
jgi:hypothetical protein